MPSLAVEQARSRVYRAEMQRRHELAATVLSAVILLGWAALGWVDRQQSWGLLPGYAIAWASLFTFSCFWAYSDRWAEADEELTEAERARWIAERME